MIVLSDIKLVGKLQSGMQKGKIFLSNPVYKDIFTRELGSLPYLGTLNLAISDADLALIDPIISSGTPYTDLVENDVKLGDVIVYPIILSYNYNVQKSVIVRPLRTTHKSNVLEIVAPIFFRGEWELVDGDEVEIIISDSLLEESKDV